MMLGAGAGMLGGAMLASGYHAAQEDAYEEGYGKLMISSLLSLCPISVSA